MTGVKKLLLASAAAIAGAATADLVRRTPYPTKLSALGLVGISTIYPFARRGLSVNDGGHLAFGAGAVAMTAVANESIPARHVVAGGWAAHSLIHLVTGPGKDSRLPAWYPTFSTGFDLGYAIRLAI
jgi:hypothetical protein